MVLTLGYQLEKETQHDIGTIAVHMVKHLNERQRSTSSFDGANGCNIVVSRQSVFIAYGGKVTPRASVARIFITQIYHTKPQSRKEEEKEIVFFPSFATSAPLREPFFRRPSGGWGLSRLSSQRGAIRRDAIGSSLRWSDGVFGGIGFCLCTLRSARHDGCWSRRRAEHEQVVLCTPLAPA